MEKYQCLLVTGGAGFIGSNLVFDLIEHGVKVVNLDALTYAGNPENLAALKNNPQHVFVHGNIADRELLRTLFETYQPDGVIHLAAESHVDRSIDNPDLFIETNVVGTHRLLDASRAYWQQRQEEKPWFRFLHVSTDEVFGSLGNTGYFSETTPHAPNSPYAASKAASDHFVRAYFHTYKLPVLTSNCSNNYGPYQFPEKLIPLMILSAIEGKPLPVYGKGTNVRDWLYVGDHCKALIAILLRGRIGETYNVGGNNEKSNIDVVQMICRELDALVPGSPNIPHAGLISFVADRPGHDQRYAIDSSKLQSELGWKPTQSFETGLHQTITWYLQNQEWCGNILSGAYKLERLGIAD